MALSKTLVLKALRITMQEYFSKTSFNGFRLLHFIRRRKYQSCLWSLFIMLSCGMALYAIIITLSEFLETPTVTTLSPQKNTIWNVPFPALSLCSVNKFSRQKMEAFARDVAKRSEKAEEYWLEKMQLLAGYYDERVLDFDESMTFELELKKVIGADYDVATILREMAPSCEELLLSCNWAGETVDCMDYFNLVATVAGHCCMFNRREQNVKSSSTIYANGTGIRLGLAMVLNTSTADYYFKSRYTNGYHLQIFEASSFPDISTGEVRELTIGTSQDVSVALSVITQTADQETRRHSYKKRRCYFEDENIGHEFLSYSQSECFTRCRVKSMQFLCECTPYYIPKWVLNKNFSTCSFVDLECLAHFFFTWRIYRPPEWEGTANMQLDGLSCQTCYPLCSFNHFYYKKESFNLAKTRNTSTNRRFLANFTAGINDISLLKIYFPHPHTMQYNTKVLYTWYQILSAIGGVLGISIGCSLISAFEWFYFFTYRLYLNILKQQKMNVNN